MENKISQENFPLSEGCCGGDEQTCDCGAVNDPFPMAEPSKDSLHNHSLHNHGDANPACCGVPSETPENRYEIPGYTLCRFVERFLDTPAGPVPKIKTASDRLDLWGTVSARLGIGRDRYKIAPGLYAAGDPGPDSPVLVTANYKLTFDTLRNRIKHLDVWILVLDTKGVNVWCAAGKGTFSTAEVVRRVKATGLDRVVDHRKLILPQLAATGVAAREVKKGCGFEVVWGPVRASDVKPFLNAGMKAEKSMRQVDFPLKDRLVLIPVEIALIGKPALWALLAIFLLSGIGPGVFSVSGAWHRGLLLSLSAVVGVIAGAGVTPALLPWIPGRPFAVKGVIPGLALGSLAAVWFGNGTGALGVVALVLVTGALSSYMAMNFTGSTPFTSPSGVEKEMRRGMPAQALSVLIGAALWVAAAFAGVHS